MRHLKRYHLQALELLGSDRLDKVDQGIVVERVVHSERCLGHSSIALCNSSTMGSSDGLQSCSYEQMKGDPVFTKHLPPTS
jgi:hypothetical protein